MNVVIMEHLGIPEAELTAKIAPFEAEGVRFRQFQRTTDIPTLISEASGAEVMILANMPMPAEVIRACPALKFIDVAFTGVDHIGLEAAKAQKIAVSNASGYSNEAVAELVLGMVLSMARNLRAVEDRCRSGGTKDGLVGWEIKGKTVGIVGLGKIGTRTAELFHAFGAELLASSRTVHPDAPEYVRQVSLEELLRSSDIVVLHCPLNETTKNLIDAEKLSRMKPTSLLVNAARGPVVNEKALAEALQAGRIGGACLDVFAAEPPLDPLSPALQAPNTLVTPHVAFATGEAMSLRAEIVFANLRAWMDGAQQNVVLP
jgi:D-3-phosphoglycerate dehydrogenase